MAHKRVLILGANGMLGTILCSHLRKKSTYQVLTHSQTTAADFNGDLSKYQDVYELLISAQADFCINTVALTDVNLSETDRAKARKLNIVPALNLVKAISKNGLLTRVIQISTDHMYDQNSSKEEDIKIINNYALTKYVADEVLQVIDAVVLRTNFFGASASAKKSFSDWIIESLQEGKSLQGFDDVYFSPLHVETLCHEIERVLQNFISGIYNLGSREGMSKFQFMIKLAELKKLPISLIAAIPYSKANVFIPRPKDMRMQVSKYEQTYQVQLPTLIEEIEKC